MTMLLWHQKCCCDITPGECLDCISGTTPYEYDVTISGVTDGDLCSSCGDFNGTYRVRQTEYPDFTTLSPCYYHYDYPSYSCYYGWRLFLFIYSSGGALYARVRLGVKMTPSATTWETWCEWEGIISGSQYCDFTGKTIPFSHQNGDDPCQCGTVAVEISAV